MVNVNITLRIILCMAGLLSKVESDSLRSCISPEIAGSNPAPAAYFHYLRPILIEVSC